MLEYFSGFIEAADRRRHVPRNLRKLETIFAILLESSPHKSLCYQTYCSSYTWMTDFVERSERVASKLGRNECSESLFRDVAVQSGRVRNIYHFKLEVKITINDI